VGDSEADTVSRRDYWHEPGAPTANSIPPGAGVFVRDERGRVLLVQRTDSGNWTLPGGMQEFGENITRTAVREVREETGLDVEITGLVGIYTDPGHVMAYDDGEVRQEFVVLFAADVTGGTEAISEESTSLRWAEPRELDGLKIHQSVRLRLSHALEPRNGPYLG
jgi:8-oxo-dGTP pyrophosphatase MutT (NUDIX family)